MSIDRFLPFLNWVQRWREQGGTLPGMRADLMAGLSVALIMVPQAMAYAQLAGMPPHIGLYAALLPSVVAALFGSCGQLSTGPVALTALLTAASLTPLAVPGSEAFMALAVLLALLSGLFQLLFGLARLGWVLNLLSHPVLIGFVNAAALLICLSQIPPLLGLSMPHSGRFLADFWEVVRHLDGAHAPSAAFGLGALMALVLLKRRWPRLPGVLIVVAAGTGLSAWLGLADAGGRVVGVLPAGLPALAMPDIDPATLLQLAPAAFVIALVSFMEAMSSARLITTRTRTRWHENQELIGQGLGKIAASLSGAMPVSVSFSRSALSLGSGAVSGFSALVTAALVLLSVLVLAPLFHHLPIAVLAAVILQPVANLIDIDALRKAWRTQRDDGIAGLVTFVVTLLFAPNIQTGILTGLLLSLAMMLYRTMTPRTALLGLHPDGTYRDLVRFGLAHPGPNLTIVRFDGALSFVTAARFEEAVLNAALAQPHAHVVLVSAAGINALDATGANTLHHLLERFRSSERCLAFCGLKKQVIDVMKRAGVWAVLADHGRYRTEAQAVTALHACFGSRPPGAATLAVPNPAGHPESDPSKPPPRP